jgi:putative ABC transport system permease protein
MTIMTSARVFVSRALDLLRRSRRDARLDEEIEGHLALLTRDFLAQGLSPVDARVAARRAFGGVDQLESVYRDQRGLPFVDAFMQDVRFAARLLTRDRGFAVTAALVLGVGIGVNNMFFTIVNAHTIRGLPVSRASRIVYVSTSDDRNRDRGLSFPDFLDLRDRASSFVGLSAFTTAPAIVAGDGSPADRFTATFLSANAFELIGVRPVMGRGFVTADDRPGSPPVVMLGHAVWQSRYGSDPQSLGRSILVSGTPTTIVGVVPDRSGFPTTADIWLPLRLAPGFSPQARQVRNLRVLGRVRDDVPTAKAIAEVETIVDRSSPNADSGQNVRARVLPVDEEFFGRLTDPAWMAFIAAGFLVMLISCANVANLMLAHSTGRAREFAIRTSLGANRRRILRQLLIEGIVLAGAGAVVGLGISMASVRLFRSAIPPNALPYWVDYSVDARVIAALVLVSLFAVLLFALLPALHASRADVSAVLKEGGRPGTGRRTRRWTTVFLSAEFALAVVLLSQTVVSIRDASPRLPSDRTLDTRAVITATITLPDAKTTPQERVGLFRLLIGRVQALPGVASASLANALPLTGGAEASVSVRSASPSTANAVGTVRVVLIGPAYFRTLGVPLIQGRDFTESEGTPASPVTVVNARFAEKFLTGANPLGQQIAIAPDDAAAPSDPLTIVGVAADVRQRASSDPEPVVYLPYQAAPPTTLALLLRIDSDASRVVPLLRNAVMKIDPDLPVYRIQTMAEVLRNADWNRRLSHVLVSFITLISVALSTVGLYAVTAHGVSQRTQEIGVRMALGARSSAVVLLVFRRVLAQLACGFVAGVVCTIGWLRMFGSPGADSRATDSGSLAAVAATLALAAAIASFFPARRAARVDPVVAIRGD